MTRRAHHSHAGFVWALAVLAVAALGAALLVGPQALTWADVRGGEGAARRILFEIRLPRVLLGFCAGAALAMCGLVFQTLFRNPLATPFTLGVSGGAALGAAIFIQSGLALVLPFGQPLAALIGAGATILLVGGLARLRGGMAPGTLLLAGVAVNFFFSSLILVVQYLSDYTQSYQIVRWLMGSLQIVGYGPLVLLAPALILALGVFIWLGPELNLLLYGEELAASRGLNISRVRAILFMAVSILVGLVTAFCGPIGFVGLMMPHIARRAIGPDHRRLTPAVFFLGGLFLVLCDTVGRMVIMPAEVPVGIITALVGGPFFLWLLFMPHKDGGGT